MKITSGLFDNMVLQRDRQNLSQAYFEGECGHDGIIFTRVKNGSKITKTGICKNGKIEGLLKGLKAGGPYDIELFIKGKNGLVVEKAIVRNILVGDVWIMGGQSNMEGFGYTKYALKSANNVRAFYMDDHWGIAKDPIHNLENTVDKVHRDLSGGQPPIRSPHARIGPGLAFGREMLRRTGVPQGLIACAHGGSGMSDWSPALKSRGGSSLYGAMFRRFLKNGGKIAGIAWHQGCHEAYPGRNIHYTSRMVALIKAIRRDFGAPRLPVAMAQIAKVCSSTNKPEFWNSIQEQQRLLPRKIHNMAVVPTIDLSLDDTIHISGFDQNRLGKRLAQAMSVLRREKNAGLPPIELQSITKGVEKMTGVHTIAAKFRNVMGHLQSAGKPCGFSVTEGNDASPFLFRTDLEKDMAILRLRFSSKPESLAVHYGYGLAPYCNITDSADRSLPVFGPELIGHYKGLG